MRRMGEGLPGSSSTAMRDVGRVQVGMCLAVLGVVALAGCGTGWTVAPIRPAPSVAPTTTVAGGLVVVVSAPPSLTFVVGLERWKVCDRGIVENPTEVTARDVRVTVTYVDHGAVVGRTTVADAERDGGALGDVPPHQRRSFEVCGFAVNEPDRDVISAVPASGPGG